jgi:lipoate-protein ligase A
MLPTDQEHKADVAGAFEKLSNATFRLIVDTARDGRLNMAIDEALMEQAGKPGTSPVIRFYTFKPPALSVGRFQTTNNVFDLDALKRDGITFVRRPSGGQAVLHEYELTYSATVGRHLLGGLSKREFYRFLLPVLIAGLSRLEVGGTAARGERGNGDPDCFASTGEYEIKSPEGKKLIGSAQMVSRDAVLQHGSIPLGTANRRIHAYIIGSTGENSSTSLSEERRQRVSFEEAAAAFSRTAGELLDTEPSELTESELSRAEQLLKRRYETSAWNRKY